MISNKIDQILDARHGRNEYTGRGHVQSITDMVKFITILKDKLKTYSDFRANVLAQITGQNGEYYQMALNDPMFEQSIRNASVDEIESLMKHIDSELDRLKKRFERETINISVVGKARQGKSLLLRSITGLECNVIPTSNGPDCTGTTSVIYNSPKQATARANVVFYTEYELVTHINHYIENLNIGSKIGSIAQVPLLLHQIKEFDSNLHEKSGKDQSRFGHMRKYVEHYDEYKEYIGKTINISQEEIREYAAQYDENFVPTYKFLAVNRVEIFKEFEDPEVGKVVLVDTIGLGDTSLGIREKMIKTLREDSDAAILVRLPGAQGDGIREDDDSLYDLIREAMDERYLSQWLFLALNVCNSLGNINAGTAMKNAFEKRALSFAFIQEVNCNDKEDVYAKLLIPLLNYLVKNIGNIDTALIENANVLLEQLYNSFFTLCSRVGSVMKGGLKGALQSGGLFDELFEDKLNLSIGLNRLNQLYSDSDAESSEIRMEVQNVLKSISREFPSLQEIKNRLTSGGPDAYIENVYNFYADNVRANIRDHLDALNNRVIKNMQDAVKQQIVEVMKNDEFGRLGRIPLQSKDTDEPIQWLKAIIDEKLTDYAIIASAFHDIYDFRLNIEGLLEYKANIALSCYDQESPQFTRLPETVFNADIDTKVEIIRQTLIANIPIVANTLMDGIKELLKIPTNSFNARIRKLRERIIFKQEGRRELKNFYRENATVIWPDEFRSVASKALATGQWSDMADDLNSIRDKKLFTISLS